MRRGAGPHYGSARRKFIIGMGTQNTDLAGAMGVSGDSTHHPSGACHYLYTTDHPGQARQKWLVVTWPPMTRGAGPHYGPARRMFIIGMGTQNADLTGAMGVSGDSINKLSGV
eukprot:COSAG01_NODE_2986_length_6751_cov_4.682502_1_plen_113_part_00